MTTMRAWRVHEYGQPTEVLRLDEVEIPEPGPGEVRVKAQAIPLNLNDLERITGGNMMVRPEFPYSPGMEAFGIVDACGEGAEEWMGKRVAAVTKQAFGGFAEYVICPTIAAFEIDEAIPLPDAAALFFPFHLAWLGLIDRASLKAGDTVLIHAGAGGAGSAAIQIAKAFGARVYATAGGPEKVALCRELGADVAIDYLTEDFKAIVLADTDNIGVDIVFDNVGEAVMADSFACTAYNGTYLMMGFASNKVVADEKFIVPRQVTMGNFKLCGVLLNYQSDDMIGLIKQGMGWNVAPRELGELATADIVELVKAGTVRAVVGSAPSFEDLPAAMEAMGLRNTTGRVIVML